MKKTKLIGLSVLAVAFSAMLFSCNKNASPVVPAGNQETIDLSQADASIVISIKESDTKAASANIKDSQKNSLQVFIFNAATGARENSAYISSGVSATLSSFKGTKRIWAIVNYPSQLYADSEAELCALTSTLADNSLTNFVMSGYTTAVVEGLNQAVAVNVQRAAARIRIDKVIKNFAENDLSGYSLTVKEIYLKNVAGDARFDSSMDISENETNRVGVNNYTPTVWYNQLVRSSVPAINPLVYVGGLSVACPEDNNVTPETPNNIDQYLFMYPNNVTTDSSAEPFTPRKTRLVLHCEIQKGSDPAEDQFYTFNLPNQANNENTIIRNKTYIISSITISMRGKANDNDDSLTDPTSVSVTTNIDPWTGEETYSYSM